MVNSSDTSTLSASLSLCDLTAIAPNNVTAAVPSTSGSGSTDIPVTASTPEQPTTSNQLTVLVSPIGR